MAPTLRRSTQDKTKASVDAVSSAGYTRAPRQPARKKWIPRNKCYPSTKGLVNYKKVKGLQHVTNANADSPLLRLPPEIRNMIFEIALHRPNKMRLYFNSHSDYSGGGYSSHIHKRWHERIAFNLPQVCRQIYAETTTLIYRVNKFSFATHNAMAKWLSKRLPAQLEAIEHLEVLEDDDEERADILQQLKDTLCPSLRSLTKDDKTADSAETMRAWAEEQRRRERDYVSTDDEEPWSEMSDDYY